MLLRSKLFVEAAMALRLAPWDNMSIWYSRYFSSYLLAMATTED
jgi:hypothetical protein